MAVLAVQSPNFFGVIEDLEKCAKQAHDQGSSVCHNLHGAPGVRTPEESWKFLGQTSPQEKDRVWGSLNPLVGLG
jgi:hypothetical protein